MGNAAFQEALNTFTCNEINFARKTKYERDIVLMVDIYH